MQNAFTNSVSYDDLGRTYTQTVNVNGNYNANGNLDVGIPLFSKLITVNPSIEYNYFSNTNFINSLQNTTTESQTTLEMDLSHEGDKLYAEIGASYDYNQPNSTLNNINNTPYSEQHYTASLTWDLPKKFSIESDIEYNINNRRTQGYNINYFLWNASINKKLLKRENLIVSIDGTDILNQNISTERNVMDNVVTDTKTRIVGRYILLKAVYKFNSSKQKEEDDDF
jgi:hypothetical protein